MQWLIDLVIEAIGIPPVFIDRGDPGSADWTDATLTMDNTWRDLDVSAIVPANASAILFGGFMRDGQVNNFFALRKDGNANVLNISAVYTQVANIWIQQDLIVATSPSQIVEYNAAADFDNLFLTIRGWWL